MIRVRFMLSLAILTAAALAAFAPSASASDGGIHVEKVVGGPCGCYCPVVGGGASLGLAGQEVDILVGTIVVFCGTGLWLDVTPGDVDATEKPYFDACLWLDPAGLKNLGIPSSSCN